MQTPHVIVNDLPEWCGGVLYSGDDDMLTLVTNGARLPMTPEQARALHGAIGQCLTRSEQAARILEIPSDDD